MEKISGLSAAVLSSDSGLEMRSQFDELTAAMSDYEAALMHEWCALATTVSEQKLCQPVLRQAREWTLLQSQLGLPLCCLAWNSWPTCR